MAAVALSKAAVMVLQKLATASRGEDGSRTLMTGLLATLSVVILIVAMIIYVLTSPFEFAGDLGIFQTEYGHILPGQSVDFENGGGLTETEIDGLVNGVSNTNRRAVIEAALSLVGKVSYFWGGKSGPGWNDEWGTPKRVSAPGSSTSGTLLPYGMDCSGFVNWAFWTALGQDSLVSGSTAVLWSATGKITKSQLQPGDLGFKQPPNSSGVNHVGIYYGKNSDGKSIWIHCSFSGGGVVMDTYGGFSSFRQVPAMKEDTA